MSSQKIEAIIDENGDVKIETIGFSGESCIDIHKALSLALGETVNIEDKSERFQKNVINSKLKQKIEN